VYKIGVSASLISSCMVPYTLFHMLFLLQLQLAIGLLLSFIILIQHRASGLSATFGGVGTTYVQRRGAEKLLYRLTIWLSVAFFALSVVQLYL
jgi:protein translocase SecG subunit